MNDLEKEMVLAYLREMTERGGTLDTVIAVSGSDVRYTYSQEYRNSFNTFDEFWTWVVNDIEQDIAENGLEEDLEDI